MPNRGIKCFSHVIDRDGRTVAILGNDHCYDGQCGGCDYCLERQAHHAGMTVVIKSHDRWPDELRRNVNWLIEGF